MKRVLKFINFRDESGGALIIVALGMVAMLGFTAIAIDGGRLYFEKSKLQKSLDAAVLAGAQGLFVSEVHAESIAKNISNDNGYVLEDDDFETVVKNYIKAEKTVPVSMTFAKVLNIDSVQVKAIAKAEVATLKAANGIAPIAVEKTEITEAIEQMKSGTYTGTDLLCTKEKQSTEEGDDSEENSSGQHSPGNCGFLRFDASNGAADLRDALLYGGTYSVGNNYATTEPGGVNQAKKAIQDLISSDAAAGRTHCADPKTADNSCSRVVYIAVIDTWENTNGHDEVKIVDFAAYWLEDFNDQGKDKYLKGRFIKSVSPGEIKELTGGETDDLVYGVKLTE